MDVATFRLGAREGDRVRYVPGIAYGDPEHPDCEDGTITSFSATTVFVRFDAQVAKLGWDGATSQGCDPGDLRIL